MKTKVIIPLILAITLSACQKQPEEAIESEPRLNAAFERSSLVIDEFFDVLDSPSTPIAKKKQIVCVDYPAEYKNNYIPATLQIEGNIFSEEKLLAELDMALDYYKEKYNIEC